MNEETSTKKLIIINGVMGVIGSPLFTFFVEKDNFIVWGISRKGLPFVDYIDKNELLPETHLVLSLGDYYTEDNKQAICSFISAIPTNIEVIFIHTMGNFLTEINSQGEISLENDSDNDDVNDFVKKMTCEIPIFFVDQLLARNLSTTIIHIGSLSDKYELDIHHSWVKSMKAFKTAIRTKIDTHKNLRSLVLNVSSVLTPKELIDRPFITTQTNADMRYWLPPIEIAKYLNNYINSTKNGYLEEELYRPYPNFSDNHYEPKNYLQRRLLELYKKDV